MEVVLKVRAVIVQNNQMLLVEFDDETGLHYNLPGGTVETGEFLEDALVREVREETSAQVFVEQLLLTHDYIPSVSPDAYGDRRILTLVYRCTLTPDSPLPQLPANPDENETAVRWIDVDKLHTIWLLPEIVDDLWAALR